MCPIYVHLVFSTAFCYCTAVLLSSRGSYFSLSLTRDHTGELTSNDISSDFWRPCISEKACRRMKQTISLASRVSIWYIENSSWQLSDQVQFGVIQSNSDLGGCCISKTIDRRAKHFGSFAAFPGFDDFALDLKFQGYLYWKVYTLPVFFYPANDQAECQGPWASCCGLPLLS